MKKKIEVLKVVESNEIFKFCKMMGGRMVWTGQLGFGERQRRIFFLEVFNGWMF